MCRFALYLGPEIPVSSLVTEPTNSIIHQSHHSHLREEPLNGDGFGVAWYRPRLSPEPALFKDVAPAWNDYNLHHVARVTESSCILAHVRAASPGLPVTRLNCHPFAWGPFAFMHNGRLAGFRRMRRRLLAGLSDEAFGAIAGSTDTEHMFAWFIDHARTHEGSALSLLAMGLETIVRRAVALAVEGGVEEASELNLAVTDGSRAAVCRCATGGAPAPTLFFRAGEIRVGADGKCTVNDGDGALVIASEPLSDDAGWRPVPRNHLLLVSEGHDVELRPLEVEGT